MSTAHLELARAPTARRGRVGRAALHLLDVGALGHRAPQPAGARVAAERRRALAADAKTADVVASGLYVLLNDEVVAELPSTASSAASSDSSVRRPSPRRGAPRPCAADEHGDSTDEV